MISTAPKRMTALVAAVLQSAMLEAPRSYDDLVAICGLSKPAVARWIKTMHSHSPKFVYVADWGEDARGRKFIPKWAWGNKPDAKRPGQKRTAAERMRALRLSRKKETTQ